MSELLMTEVQKKFASAREVCPGMSEEIYALADYLSAVANDSLVPGGIVIMLIGVMDDLKKKRCGFARRIEFPEYLATHSMRVQAQMPYILQVIDAIAGDDEFADAVRVECRQAFQWDVAKRVVVTEPASNHENINAAVNWWAETIQHPKMDNGDDQLAMVMMMFGVRKHQYTTEQIQKFREVLTSGLVKEMDRMGRATLSVDYDPDRLLYEAGKAIGMGQFDFPCKTTMWITDTEVSVRAGYGAPQKVIWSTTAVPA